MLGTAPVPTSNKIGQLIRRKPAINFRYKLMKRCELEKSFKFKLKPLLTNTQLGRTTFG